MVDALAPVQTHLFNLFFASGVRKKWTGISSFPSLLVVLPVIFLSPSILFPDSPQSPSSSSGSHSLTPHSSLHFLIHLSIHPPIFFDSKGTTRRKVCQEERHRRLPFTVRPKSATHLLSHYSFLFSRCTYTPAPPPPFSSGLPPPSKRY